MSELGSISHGTLRTPDLLTALSDALVTLDYQGCYASLCNDAVAYSRMSDNGHLNDDGEECAAGILEELDAALQEFAPSYCYFGTHPGDGANFGFWLCEDFQEQFREGDGIEVSDLSEVPDDFRGEVLHINDHGNATLYAADRGKLLEVWSMV